MGRKRQTVYSLNYLIVCIMERKVILTQASTKLIDCQVANLELYRKVQETIAECLGADKGRELTEAKIAPIYEAMYSELKTIFDDLFFEGVNNSEGCMEIAI